MSISTLSVKRPVLAIVMNLIIVLFGIIGYTFLGVREFPSIDPPIITVTTSYPGANAKVIESDITDPLEKAINGIAGIRSISSASNLGSSRITVEFELNIDLEAAANDVRDKVSQAVRNLPKDIDGIPQVSKADANSDAIVSMTVQNDALSQMELSDFAENVLAQRLQTIEGVSTVQIWGQKKYAMRLRIDPEKMAALNITAIEVQNALMEHVELPAGKVAGSATELNINILGKLKNEDEFNNLIIRNDSGKITRFKDIGLAELGSENEETILRSSGVPMIGLGVVPQPGANYINIADAFFKRFEQLKKEIPKEYKLDIAMDNTRFIRKSIEEVEETLIISIILVIIIIYLFFRDWLVAFRPLIDIPVSLVGTFFIMYIMGFSINILTLLAIVLATGLVVDDGIVVTENIYKKIEKGMSPIEAAIKGSNEIMFAVISTSLTLAAVFLPIVFMEGFVGKLFTEFGVVIAAAVLISAFVSLTLTPMLNAYMVRKNHQKKSWFYLKTEPFFEGMENKYKSSLSAFISRRWWSWVVLPIITVVGILFFLKLPSELAPMEDRSWFRVQVSTPEGASYEYTDAFMLKLSDFIQDSIPEKQFMLVITAPGFTGSGAVNTGMVRLRLSEPDQRKRSQQDIANYFTGVTSQFPEGRVFVNQEQTISLGGGIKGLPVQMQIQAPNFDSLRRVIPIFMDSMAKDPVFMGTDVDLKFNKPEIEVVPDVEKADAVGVPVNAIAQSIQYNLSGLRYAYFTMNGKQYQVIGQVNRVNRNDPSDLTGIYVRSNTGKLIQIENVVKKTELSSPPQLYRYNRYVSAKVSAGIAPGKTMGDAVKSLRRISKNVLGPSFSTATAGSARDYEESSSNFLYTFGLAVLLIYLVLSAQFESFTDPLIILLTIPLAFAGATFSLWYFNQTWNIFSQIGIVMLVGLVVKNGILIVEFANHLRDEGLEKKEAVINAAAGRLRPILMTNLATSLGALPIAMALGSGSVSRMGMGIVVVGGIMISLVLTLFVIPAVYTYLSRKKRASHESPVIQMDSAEPSSHE